MAEYKVPQDVEAEDKLLGPLSFRQFIYAGIALGGATLAFFLFQIFPLLAVIPLPVIFLFGTLALPLRKDQPMETYLLALLRFYLKPKLRLWNPDGTITYVEITAPKLVEHRLTKEYDAASAQERLSYLARVMDSRGWALKDSTQPQNSVLPSVTAEVQQTTDVMDEHTSLSRTFDNLIAKTDQKRLDSARQAMRKAALPPREPATPAVTVPPARPFTPANTAPRPDDKDIAPLHYNPYPNAMHQKVIHTLQEQEATIAQATEAAKMAAKAKASTVPTEVPPAIMKIATTQRNLSIEGMSNEAHRLQDKDEVVINLH